MIDHINKDDNSIPIIKKNEESVNIEFQTEGKRQLVVMHSNKSKEKMNGLIEKNNKYYIKPIIVPTDVNITFNEMKKVRKSSFSDSTEERQRYIIEFGLANPLPLHHNDIKVMKSDIHNNGLFTTKLIPKGVVITFYPASAAIMNVVEERDNIKRKEQKVYFFGDDNKKFQDQFDYNTTNYGYQSPAHIFLSTKFIADPDIIHNPLLLGHMINDCSGNIFKDVPLDLLKNEKKLIELINKYRDNGKNRVNCEYMVNDNHTIVSIVTTKIIKKNQELLIYYDIPFWLNFNYGESLFEDETVLKNIYKVLNPFK
jgi:hypothetical protein